MAAKFSIDETKKILQYFDPKVDDIFCAKIHKKLCSARQDKAPSKPAPRGKVESILKQYENMSPKEKQQALQDMKKWYMDQFHLLVDSM